MWPKDSIEDGSETWEKNWHPLELCTVHVNSQVSGVKGQRVNVKVLTPKVEKVAAHPSYNRLLKADTGREINDNCEGTMVLSYI